MSQRTFTHNGMKVLTGWDRPLQYFFLVIEDSDDYVFSNLSRPDPRMTIPEIERTLDHFEIKYPESLFEDLLEDKKLDRGNHFIDYDR